MTAKTFGPQQRAATILPLLGGLLLGAVGCSLDAPTERGSIDQQALLESPRAIPIDRRSNQ